MHDNMRLVSYPPQGKEKEAGDAAKNGDKEVAAVLAYASKR